MELRRKESRNFDTRDLTDAIRMRERLDDPLQTTYKSMRDIRDSGFYWGTQRVDMVPSNLGQRKGYIFYFRCNGCGRRAKHLYVFSMLKSPLCRVCCRISYKQPNRKQRTLSKLLNMPYLSTEAKYAIIKCAGITKEDF